MKKKKILVIGPGLEIGGVEKSMLSLLDAIDYEQFDVDLFLFSHSGELKRYLNPNVTLLPAYKPIELINQPIIRLFKNGYFYVGSVRLFCKVYADIKGKITHTQSVNTTLCKKIFTKTMKMLPGNYEYALGFFGPHYLLEDKVKADVKVGWVHTDYTNENEKQDLEFYYPMWNKLKHIACVSNSARESFNCVYPALADRTITIENIISPSLIEEQANECIRNGYIDDGSINVLSVGRFCTAKAFDLIPEVCFRLIEKGYRIRWYIIGYGPDESLIQKKILEFAMADRVVLLGKKTNPYPYMKACDIYVQPSRYEGKAVTVTEAQILHKPVIITRYNTSSSQVHEGIDGYICEMGVEGIVEGLSFLLDHKDVREKLIAGTMSIAYDNAEEINKIWNWGKF